VALDATTGRARAPVRHQGRVDLKQGMLDGLKDGRYALESPPGLFGDVVITGSSNGRGFAEGGSLWRPGAGTLDREAAVDLSHGAAAGVEGSETWPPDGWKNRSGANVWGFPHHRPEARDRVRAAGFADGRFLTARTAWETTFTAIRWSPGRADRQKAVAPATGAYDLGITTWRLLPRCSISAAEGRCSGGGADHQMGLPVRVRPA